MDNKMLINTLPAPTWNRLKMNETIVENFAAGSDAILEKKVIGGGVAIAGSADVRFAGIATGMGPEAVKALAGRNELNIVAEEAAEIGQIMLHIAHSDGQEALQIVNVLAKKNSKLTVWMDLTTAEDPKNRGKVLNGKVSESTAQGSAAEVCAESASGSKSGSLSVLTKVILEEGAEVKLVQLELVNAKSRAFVDIGAVCAKSATLETAQILLGAQETYLGQRTLLDEKYANVKTTLAYYGKDEQKLDMNYVAQHVGKRTESNLDVYGVLRDRSEKLFRGTIDFVNGSAGSVGDENESVLLLDEGVVNRTIPLILCAEEDVQGNHGASIGQLDEEMLFYMGTRGIPEEEAIRIIARARLEAMCAKIGNEEMEKLLTEHIDAVMR